MKAKTEPTSEFFWTSGADGRLRLLKCSSCALYFHPPAPRCPHCRSSEVAPAAVSGVGLIESFTMQTAVDGRQRAIVWVRLAEQDDLRLTSELVGPTDQLQIGMRVAVEFQQRTPEVFVPVFRAQSG